MKIYRIKIKNITDYYLYVETSTKENGYIHISEISHFYVSDLKKNFEIGDILYAEHIGYFKGKLNLSLKTGLSSEKKKSYKEVGGGFLPLEYLLKKLEEKND